MRMMILNNADRAEFIRRISDIPLGDGKRRYVADFKVHRKARSLAANRLYWLWLNCISKETGNSTDDLADFFKKKFLAWDSIQVFGEESQRYVTTTVLDSKQFSEYLEQIRMFALEQSIFLPSPGDQAFDDFYLEYHK